MASSHLTSRRGLRVHALLPAFKSLAVTSPRTHHCASSTKPGPFICPHRFSRQPSFSQPRPVLSDNCEMSSLKWHLKVTKSTSLILLLGGSGAQRVCPRSHVQGCQSHSSPGAGHFTHSTLTSHNMSPSPCFFSKRPVLPPEDIWQCRE